MLFNSLEFIIFFPIVVAAYFPDQAKIPLDIAAPGQLLLLYGLEL